MTIAPLSILPNPALSLALRLGQNWAQTLGWILPFFLGSAAQAQPALNPVIDIGIVQRFGQNPTDRLNIAAPSGDRLTLVFTEGNQSKTIEATQLTLDVPRFPQPITLDERVVLSTHRSFESAEDSAAFWQNQGIPVELAQPGTWEVWAKRSVYATPLLRRILVENLNDRGHQEVYLTSQVVQEKKQAAWVVNGYRYHRDQLNIQSKSGVIWVDQTPYPGTLHLQPNSYGTYTLVNAVTIEDYLRGVVPYEIGPAAPPAAVEAQAILARTYALRNVRRFAIDRYELCADTQCQVYRGWLEPVARADQAIRNTRGLVLTYENQLIDAVYSSTTGGVTAAFEDVWNGAPRPYLQPVIDALPNRWDLAQKPLSEEANLRNFIQQTEGFNEVGWDYFRWRTIASLDQLKVDLQAYLQKRKHSLSNFQAVLGLTVKQRALSGRVQQLEVRLKMPGNTEELLILEKDQILQALETPNSIFFYLDPLRGTNQALTGYAFVGGGYGHGVGLSQTGSYHLADLGWSSANILQFYYTNTALQPLAENFLESAVQ